MKEYTIADIVQRERDSFFESDHLTMQQREEILAEMNMFVDRWNRIPDKRFETYLGLMQRVLSASAQLYQLNRFGERLLRGPQ